MILISKLLNIPFKRFRIWYAVFVNFGLHFIHVSYILWISFFSNFKFSCILLVSCRKVSTKCQSLLFSSLFDAPNFFGISLLGQLNLIHIYNKNFFFTYHLKWIFHPKLMPKQKMKQHMLQNENSETKFSACKIFLCWKLICFDTPMI